MTRRLGSALKWASVVLGALYLLATAAPMIAPYTPEAQHREFAYAPPQRPHWIDRQGRWHWRPFIYELELQVVLGERSLRKTEKIVPIQFFTRGVPYDWFGLRLERHLIGPDDPARPFFLLGADRFGRDLLTRLLYGARVTLTVGPTAVLLTLAIGLVAGALAGYRGGWADVLIMRLAELMLSLPGLFLLLALRAVFPSELSPATTYFMIVALFSLIGWASVARVVRSIVLQLRNLDYVEAARAQGARPVDIFARHLLPGLQGYLLVQATFLVPAYMLAEVTLSFLGLGIPEPGASWGTMLSEATSIYTLTHYTWILLPAAFIFTAALCFNLIGDELRSRLDPRLRTRIPRIISQ